MSGIGVWSATMWYQPIIAPTVTDPVAEMGRAATPSTMATM